MALSIMGIMNLIDTDNVVLPAIQREFVWDEDQIVTLVDSIMRGYPVGIALLWETFEDIQYREFVKDYWPENLPSFRSNSRKKKLKVVLDGQQRLQSLYVALCGKYEDKDLYFDILSGRESDSLRDDKYIFRFMTQKEIEEANQLPEDMTKPKEKDDFLQYYVRVSDLYDMSLNDKKDLIRKTGIALDLPQKSLYRADNNLQKFQNAFIDGPTPLQLSIVDENLSRRSRDRKSESDVLEIFVRVNTQGTELNRLDLIFSMLKLNWRESAQLLPKFLHRINKHNSFSLKTDFVIRCLFAVSDLGARFNLDLVRSKTNAQMLKENFERCCNAIEATLDFIIQICRCHSTNIIASNNTIIPFVYYFYHLPGHEIKASQTDAVRKAFYLAAFAKVFTQYSESRVDAYINQILKPNVRNKRQRFPFNETLGFIVQRERIRSYNDLLSQNPVLGLHLIQGLTGTHFKYAPNAPEVDHIFPRSKLLKKGMDKIEINHYANFWILAKGRNQNKYNEDPGQYFKKVPRESLKRALIDRRLLKYSGYKKFLKNRSEAMVRIIKKILRINSKDFDLMAEI